MAKICVESLMTESYCPIESLSAPVGISVTSIGITGSTTYGYRISALNYAGESLASSTVTTTIGTSILNSSNFNRIIWSRTNNASSYNVYGRTSGSELLISNVLDLYFDDFGSITPNGNLPVTNTSGYSSSKISIGSMFTALSDGSISVLPIATVRPREAGGTSVPVGLGCAVSFNNYIDWVFGADSATAATTRRISLYKYYKQTGVIDVVGFVNLFFPAGAGNYTIRGLQASYNVYNKGYVNAVGWAVTGTNTSWFTDGIAVGSRIGFGTIDPGLVTEWYEITVIFNNNTIGINTTLSKTLSANSVYCIDDLKILLTATNTVTALSGLYVVKGLRYESFSNNGGPVGLSSLTNVDNRRAVYFLQGAPNPTPNGLDIEPFTSWTSQNAYFVNNTASPVQIMKFNFRAGLSTVAGGVSTNAYLFTTGSQAVAGTPSSYGNGRIITTAHGPGLGTSSLYFATTSNIYRAAITGITSGSTTFLNDTMIENPPGTSSTYSLSTTMNTVDYMPGNDRLLIYTQSTFSTRHYVTRYGVNTEFSGIFAVDTKQLDTSQSFLEIMPSGISATLGATNFSYTLGNMTYVFRDNTGTALGDIYTHNFTSDFGADQISGNSQFIITPAFSCPNNVMFDSVYVNVQRNYNTNIYNQSPPEPCKIWYRTSGFVDNTGIWTSVPVGGALSSIGVSTLIQFKVALRTIGNYCYPNRVYAVGLNYENSADLPSYLNWNFTDSISTSGTVGFIQNYYYGGVPNLQIDYFDSLSNVNILSQTGVATTNGSFQFWSGSDWIIGLGSDLINQRRRFVPSVALGVSSYYVRLKTI